jgi:hypothetical protein
MGLFTKKRADEREGIVFQVDGSGAGEDNTSPALLDWDETCAWCLEEQGVEAGEGSHGICTRHAEQVYQSYRSAPRRAR